MFIKKLLPLLLVLLVVGCAKKDIYNWDDYEATLYLYHQQDKVNTEEQIVLLEKNIDKSRAKSLLSPPGLHAHLGLLYSNIGKIDEAKNQFEIEKQLFVESTTFMDLLLNQGTRNIK
ncbi:DUF4810 domain-containing protein [Orbus wheelerorum]|uniref:DUF4810 domain-containing protein n=1 Tax=Orbus wheelerorum TaxID=3074111 RepID=UPI00370DCFCE